MANQPADEPFPFRGRVVWLTPEQGGRQTGPPRPDFYAANAFVPPHTAHSGLASFVLRNLVAGALVTPAEARWLVVENSGPYRTRPGRWSWSARGPSRSATSTSRKCGLSGVTPA